MGMCIKQYNPCWNANLILSISDFSFLLCKCPMLTYSGGNVVAFASALINLSMQMYQVACRDMIHVLLLCFAYGNPHRTTECNFSLVQRQWVGSSMFLLAQRCYPETSYQLWLVPNFDSLLMCDRQSRKMVARFDRLVHCVVDYAHHSLCRSRTHSSLNCNLIKHFWYRL